MNNALSFQKMREDISRHALLGDTRGAVAVTVAIVIVVLLSFAALALDIGNAMIARNELQNVADAAALAGARQLGVIYQQQQLTSPGTPYTAVTIDPSQVNSAVTGVASQNQARQVFISINIADICIGIWDSTSRAMPSCGVSTGPTAVRVTARRDPSANGPVATWLAGIMGINSMNVMATGTAALTGTGVLLPGTANAPFGIDQLIFMNPNFCGTPIQFYPTNNPPSGCAGWQTFLESPPNAATERQILQGLTPNPPTYITPQITVGQTSLNYIGGNVASDFPALINLFTTHLVPDTTGLSPTGQCWNVTIPVYPDQNCANPNTAMMTIGFASACVYNVQGVPTQQINAIVTCGQVTNGQGGGGNFGTLGSIPGLVE